MKNIIKLLGIGVITIGLSGVAFADLSDGSFEDPATAACADPTEWTSTGAGVNDFAGWAPFPDGDQYLATACDGDPDESAYQDVELPANCSPYDLAEWAASGEYYTWDDEDDGNDTAYWAITGVGASGGDDPLTGASGQWNSASDDGNIAEGSTTARVTVGGKAVADTGDNGAPDVGWDDVFFETDCAVYFAKVSGKFGEGRGTHSLGGAFGWLQSETAVGTVEVNYRDYKTTCTFTAEDLGFFSEGGGKPIAVWETSYTCSGDFDWAGDALFGIRQDVGGPEGKNKLKERGFVSVSGADHGEVEFGSPGQELRKGNTHVGDTGNLPF